MAIGPRRAGPGPVAWDEAREVLVVVLLAATVMVVLAPIFGWLSIEKSRWDRANLGSALTGVSPGSGLTVLGAAVLIATTPVVDVVPGLRRMVVRVAWVCALLGIISMGFSLTAESADSGIDVVWSKLRPILAVSGPATLLASTSAWVAARVVLFPGG